MPLNEQIKKRINDLSRPNTLENHNKIHTLLINAINSGEATLLDILDYATYEWSNPKRYVIDASTLNSIGVYLSSHENFGYQKYSGQFYKIAADRNDSYGCQNYAENCISGNILLGITQSPEIALQYAQKAVDLTKRTKSPYIHTLVFVKALRINNKFDEANTALVEYLKFHLAQSIKDFQEEETNKGLILLELTTNEYDAIINTTGAWGAGFIEGKLKQIELLLKQQFTCPANKNCHHKMIEITHRLLLLNGKYLELANRDKEAWSIYCSLSESSQSYKNAIHVRANLLKKTVAKMLLGGTNPHDDTDTLAEKMTEVNISSIAAPLSMIDMLLESTDFSTHWKKGNHRFDLLRFSKLDEDYENKIKILDAAINTKNNKIKLLEKKLKTLNKLAESYKEESLKINKKLTQEKTRLNNLEETKDNLDEQYSKHKAKFRQLFRRGQSEQRFFNPHRLKNKETIVALTHQIIDQRFGLTNATTPINLTGISVRRLAAAEKAFQNALCQLSASPHLHTGIPIARKSSYSYGNGANHYGPIETYTIGEINIQFEHRENPKSERLGDSFASQLGNYNNDIYKLFNELTEEDPEKEKQLAQLLISFGKKLEPISLNTLKNLKEDANENDCEKFNKICTLIMTREQSQWLSTTTEVFRGLAVMHARCLLLIAKGYLTIKEVFKNNVFFSVYSNTNIRNEPDKVLNACERIDALYLEYLKTLEMAQYSRMFRTKLTSGIEFSLVSTREQAHQDLKEVYGGAEDSDGEEYDSDLEMKPF